MRWPSPLIAVLLAGGGCRYAPPATFPVPPAPPDAARVEVVRVIDGDTLVVRGPRRPERVRLIGVDAPELPVPGAGPGDCHGREAAHALRRLTAAGAVLWTSQDREPRDRYGRSLRYVWTGGGQFVNAALIRRGDARAMLVRPNGRYFAVLRAAEVAARRAGRGLWSACPRWAASRTGR